MALARGITEEEAMFELFGRDTGNVHGLGGSMHLFNPEQGFYGGWGLVGQQVPVGTGLAFAQKYNETDNVVVCLLGDGAVHQGAVHESLNLASIWDLPIVYIVENNHYGMGTAVERISALPPLHRIGQSYDIEHSEFDGMDVLESYDAVSEAVEYARSESRPVFLEGKCSRFKGHSMSDPAKYRTREELEEEKSRDPIPHIRQLLIDKGILTEEEVDQIDKDAKKKMKEVAKQAEDEPWPDTSILDDYVFA
jgi:pyruvate dehydrogenase E1 component alpha subunit